MDADAAPRIRVEVAYALPERQRIVALEVPRGTTVFQAAERSGLATQFDGIDLESAKMGIFGKVVANPRTQVLEDGDRVEIYRPLRADPKDARKARARKAASAKD
ncbi:MAG: Protein RnfH [Pseudomonadales bacterium]|nr:Protein RnfH [Pseudomonadales bacterium]